VKIIVNDANILIDLVELDILSHFFGLEFEFHTTDLILAELFDEQQKKLIPYIENGSLAVDAVTEDDLIEIIFIRTTKPSLSEQDCSALYQAEKEAAILITSDNTLRRFATTRHIEVHGHLWIFDHLVAGNFLSGAQAIEKLNELRKTINPRLGLPENECQKRIITWKNL
jgi:rRNA-processing protein FCF1